MSELFDSETEGIRWNEIEQRAVEILSGYIQLDTTNPPGNESMAASYLAQILDSEGIESAIYESAPGRANLVARLRGSGEAPPLLLLHHMDVVTANANDWSVPPFDGIVRDGFVWGRGAIDDKGLGVIHLMAFVLAKRLNIPLKRDVILLAVSDEEDGGQFGAKWMIDNHWPEIECEYVWDEGGAGTIGIMGSRPIISVSVTEKRSVVVKLTARGAGGHGSMASGTPLDKLVAALHALQGYDSGIKFNDVTRDFFHEISQTQGSLTAMLMRNAEKPLIKSFMSGQVRRIPNLNAMLRDTLTATIVRAGEKANVAPDTAEATLDARLLPDTDPNQFLADIRRIIKDDSVTVEMSDVSPSPPASPVESPMMEALEEAIANNIHDEFIFAPMQTPVATDSRFFREKGAKAYGLIPIVVTRDELNTIHGIDERISIENLTLGIQIALDLITELCGKQVSGAGD